MGQIRVKRTPRAGSRHSLVSPAKKPVWLSRHKQDMKAFPSMF
jgi:hypothetical protein